MAGDPATHGALEARIASLEADLREAVDQRAAVDEVLSVIGRAPELQPVFETVVRNAVRLCRADGGAVWQLDGDTYRLAFVAGGPPEYQDILARTRITPGVGTLVGRVALEARPVQLEDAAADSRYELREAMEAGGFRTVLGVPIVTQQGVVGVIALHRNVVDPFSDRAVDVVMRFARQGAIAIENVRLFRDAQRRSDELAESVDELRVLGEVSQAVNSTLDVDQVLTTIITHAVELADADGGSIFEFDAATETFELRTAHGTGDDLVDALRGTRIALRETLVGRAALDHAARQVPDLADVPSDPHLAVLRAHGWRSMLAVPLVGGGEILGATVVRRRSPGGFSPRAVSLAETLANQSAVAIANARVFRELEEKTRQLEVASRHKSEFLASMSHELRTPLNAVIGFSDVLLERMFGELNAKQDEYLRDIRGSGRHLLALLNDILDLSKVEAGRMELELAPVAVADVVEHGVTMLRERAASKGISLEHEVDADVGVVLADELRLKQVLLNLLTNAVKFTPDGGAVTVRARAAGDEFHVEVADTGIGIPEADRERIFEAFNQGDRRARSSAEGTGLGLTLTKRIVELHGGRMWLRASEPGPGSTFGFALPVGRRVEPVSRPVFDSAGAVGDEADAPVVVVIEDDRHSLDLLTVYLNSAGFSVAAARDGEEGLALARRTRPVAVVLDILLPKLDGWELLTRLKADPANAALPVIVTSMLDERGRGFALGAAEYLVKPVARDDLLAALARACAERRDAASVVVIDDDPEALELVAAMLEPRGYTVIRAASGEEGIRLVHELQPAVVLVDLLMPGVDGFEVVERLRSSPDAEAVPVIVLTAKVMTEADKERLRGQISFLAAKGEVDGPRLAELVRRLVDGRAAQGEVAWPAS
jgi:signal transduction histidine kinase/DNA-binding response OmpR family regulator